jgi:NDP-sugar pyrophosphorylase family protein
MIAACGGGTALLETLASIPKPMIEMQMSRDRR